MFIKKDWRLANNYGYLAALAALVVGLGTLFRPETPLLLVAAWVVLGFVLVSQREAKRWLRTVAGMGLLCALPLAPWAMRNAVTLHEFQFLAPKNSNLPGELVPYGFMSWEKTWLYRFRDVYLVPWKLNDEAIRIEDIPARAFDTPEERERVAAILEPYNNDLTLTPEEDQAFGELARQRTARHPLRTYVWLPLARAVTMWFTPRIELIPVSGTVFPLVQSWEDDKIDQSVTVGLFLLNIVYVGLAIWGAARLWRQSAAVRPAVAVLIVFILLRTAFLTTLETPEPRYVLVCFPALIALAAQVFSRSAEP
jgi:4-amino-4-deoxy-L-arabinose transferase-like glycosyltransferase